MLSNKQTIIAYKEFCKVNNLKESNYKSLKEFFKNNDVEKENYYKLAVGSF